MRNLLNPLSLFIIIYIVIATLFTFNSINMHISDTNINIEEDISISVKSSSSYVTEMLNISDDNGIVDTSGVIIDNVYTQMVLEQFVIDAEKNGLKREDVIKHIKSLDAILVDDLNQYGLFGITIYRRELSSPTGMRAMIIINRDLLDNPDLYMFTLYHELGHWFGLEHCSCSNTIMMDGYYEDEVNEIFSKWDKSVKVLMRKIKKGYNRKGNDYGYPNFQ